ncbi:MAG: helix-turn-helix transcriptional regulator [Butyribacter sp.]|nr:helix-turn-helix transcriptional regulator [bacterium]MDY3855161.1 helix-turn-helix transcriptional regulator [Butyribacter sp.]
MDYHDTLTCKEFGLRLAKLRESRGISARQMSLDMGQNKNYINAIETGNNFPTMNNFFTICEYLHITPQRFFQPADTSDILHEDFIRILNTLPADEYHHLYQLACDLQSKHHSF